MDRRNFIKGGAAVALGSPALVGYAKDSYQLTYQTMFSEKSPFWIQMCTVWMDKIEKESGGRIKFQRQPNLSGGSRVDTLLNDCMTGKTDIAFNLPSYAHSKYLKSEVAQIPFLIKNTVNASKAYYEYLLKEGKSEFKGAKLLAAGCLPPGVIHTSKKRIIKLEDLNSLALRTPNRLTSKYITLMKAKGVSIPVPAMKDALRSGEVDGLFIPWEMIKHTGAIPFLKYHAEFDEEKYGAFYSAGVVKIMNSEKFNSLPKDLQEIIEKNSGFELSRILGLVPFNASAEGVSAAKANNNIITKIEGENVKAFQNLALKLEEGWISDMEARGHNGSKLLSSFRELLKKHNG